MLDDTYELRELGIRSETSSFPLNCSELSPIRFGASTSSFTPFANIREAHGNASVVIYRLAGWAPRGTGQLRRAPVDSNSVAPNNTRLDVCQSCAEFPPQEAQLPISRGYLVRVRRQRE